MVLLNQFLIRLRAKLGTNDKNHRSVEESDVLDNYPWNFAVNLFEGLSFWFGLSFASTTTILPLFVSKLTHNPLALGVLAAIDQGAWEIPQLFVANWVESQPQRKPIVVKLGFFLDRLPFWFMALSATLLGWSQSLALVIFLLAFSWRMLGAGIIANAWQDLIARCFPVTKRGRFLGISQALGVGIGVIGVAASAYLLMVIPYPQNFMVTFGIAAFFVTVSWIFLALTREPISPDRGEQQTFHEFWSRLPQTVGEDELYRRFLFFRTLMVMGGAGTGFLAVAAIRQWGISDGTVTILAVALMIGQAIGNASSGVLADRFGHKLSLVIGALAATLGFWIAYVSPSYEWYFVVFALIGLSAGVGSVSGLLIILEFTTPERRPTYIGLTNTTLGIAGILAPLAASFLATFSFRSVMVASAMCSSVSFFGLQYWVKDPRFARSELQHKGF